MTDSVRIKVTTVTRLATKYPGFGNSSPGISPPSIFFSEELAKFELKRKGFNFDRALEYGYEMWSCKLNANGDTLRRLVVTQEITCYKGQIPNNILQALAI